MSPCFDFFHQYFFSTDLPIIDLLFLPLIHLILYRPSLVASNTLFDAPEPLFTSDFHNRCRKHRCRQILTSGEKILAFLELRTYTCSTNNPSTWQRGLCRILLVNNIRHGMRIDNKSIAFLSFLWVYYHDITIVAIYILIIDAKS